MKFVSLTAFSSLVCASALFVACGPGNGAGDGNGGDGDGDIGEGVNGSGGSDDGGIDGVGAMNGEGASTGTGGGPDEPMEDCDSTLELIIRDFNADHPDMQAFNGGQDPVGCGIVMPDLAIGADGSRQPTFQNGFGTGKRSVGADFIVTCSEWDYMPPVEVTSAETFGQWYANVEGTNVTLEHTLPLTEDPTTGNFVYDSEGTSGFFPIDGLGLAEETQGHNFHFTTEAHVKFGYKAGQKFTFSGDDDLWIFVNGKLALDLGGLHSPIKATIDFDAQAAALGIKPGMTYNMDIYHAERHTGASNFRVETNISCFETVVVPVIVK